VNRWMPIVTSPSAVWSLILALSVIAFGFRLRSRHIQRRRWIEEEKEQELRAATDDDTWPPDRFG
jgi:hypothetical protein